MHGLRSAYLLTVGAFVDAFIARMTGTLNSDVFFVTSRYEFAMI